MPAQSFVISGSESGKTVLSILRTRLRAARSTVQRLVREHRLRLNGKPCLDLAARVKAGQRLEVHDRTQDRPRTGRRGKHGIVIRYADDQIVVVDKPPGLTTMRHADEAAEFGARGRKFLPKTLADLLPDLLADQPGRRPQVRAVHRLDKETSGLVVFARTVEAERHLGRQFRAHSMERRYLALVRGQAKPARIESFLVRDRGDGRRGSTRTPGQGQHAVTHVSVVEDLGNCTLVECHLETGRTHQVRIHLGESGTPLCGERVYDRPLHGKPLPDSSEFSRPALHAASLGLEHPKTGKRMSWTAPMPRDFKQLLSRLRKPLGGRRDDEGGTIKNKN
jgi:23S rRNA pseudouridine1911/1915/1917 synthase